MKKAIIALAIAALVAPAMADLTPSQFSPQAITLSNPTGEHTVGPYANYGYPRGVEQSGSSLGS